MGDALTSLWGAGHRDAIKNASTTQAPAMPGKREQTILTPPCVIEALQKLWPDGIALDPCAEPGQRNVPALRHYEWPQRDGLSEEWADRTFCNPPYGDLKRWMLRSGGERVEHAMLVPVRTHRQWFQISNYDAVAFLRPLKFVGFKQEFPAPLCVLYRAGRCKKPDDGDFYFRARRAFREAFAPISTRVIAVCAHTIVD